MNIEQRIELERALENIEATNLRAVAEKAILDLAAALNEKQHEIGDTLTELAENREGEADLKFKLGFSIKWNLDKQKYENVLSWSVPKKWTSEGRVKVEGGGE